MKYRIYNRSMNTVSVKYDWWELIECVKSIGIDWFGHNPNDINSYYDCGSFKLVPIDHYDPDYIVERALFLLSGQEDPPFISRKRHVSSRFYTVLDDFDRIINLNEIKEAIDVFKPRYGSERRKKSHYYFRYRIDPVPHTHKRKYGKYFRRVKSSNRKYYSDLTSWVKDSRTKNIFSYEWEDRMRSDRSSSWKNNKKKNKQWA